MPDTGERISVRKIALAATCIAFAALCVVVIIPNVMGLYLPPETDEQAIIDQLLEELRQDIDNAENIPEEVKETLHETVDDLEKQLDKADSTQEKIEMIQKTSQKIHETIEQLQTHYRLGEALMEHENTEELGEAVGFDRSRSIFNVETNYTTSESEPFFVSFFLKY